MTVGVTEVLQKHNTETIWSTSCTVVSVSMFNCRLICETWQSVA